MAKAHSLDLSLTNPYFSIQFNVKRVFFEKFKHSPICFLKSNKTTIHKDSNYRSKKTPSAIQRLKYIMNEGQQAGIVGLKVSLAKKGCSGLAYKMDYIKAQEIKKFDEVIESEGVKVIIDAKAVMALVGSEMAFQENELGSQFTFNNPNQKGKCGCGVSFYL